MEFLKCRDTNDNEIIFRTSEVAALEKVGNWESPDTGLLEIFLSPKKKIVIDAGEQALAIWHWFECPQLTWDFSLIDQKDSTPEYAFDDISQEEIDDNEDED